MQNHVQAVGCERPDRAHHLLDFIVTLRRIDGMDERCFRPLLCTVKAELGRGQPGLMR